MLDILLLKCQELMIYHSGRMKFPPPVLKVGNDFDFDYRSLIYDWILNFHDRDLDYLLLIPSELDVDNTRFVKEYKWNGKDMVLEFSDLMNENYIAIFDSELFQKIKLLEGGILKY
jgi:hypothetical protein